MHFTVGKKKLNKIVASHRDVQRSLDRHARERALRAETILRAHVYEGHSRIEVERGVVDRYVILSDERGQKAAAAIEYGRNARPADEDSEATGGSKGVWALHDAFDIPHRGG